MLKSFVNEGSVFCHIDPFFKFKRAETRLNLLHRQNFGFLLGNEELRDKVQKTIDEMVADGTFMKIAEQWGLEDSVCLGK